MLDGYKELEVLNKNLFERAHDFIVDLVATLPPDGGGGASIEASASSRCDSDIYNHFTTLYYVFN